MTDSVFEARLARMAKQAPGRSAARPAPILPATPEPAPAPPRTGWLLLTLLWLAFVPVGIAMRVARQLYMEIPSDAVHYNGLLGFVAVSHLVLIAVTLSAALTFRKRPRLGWIALFLWAGYGIGSALMGLKDLD